MTYLEKKYSDAIVHDTLNISNYFDPHFMIDYIDKHDIDDLRDRVLREGEEICDMTNSSTSTVAPLETSAEPQAKRRKLGSWLKESAQEIRSSSHSNHIEME